MARVHPSTLRAAIVFLGPLAGLSIPRGSQAQTQAASDAPVEVTVHGSRPRGSRDIGADDLPTQDARAVPGTFGDPLQAVAALPGVVASASGLPYFYVRGAPPANTGYFLDGVPLPALYHIGPGPSYVPAPMLDHTEFFPSTAPARFGRFAGGVIAAQSSRPSDVARGEGSIRMFDSSAFVESPVGESTTALVAGRYGYPQLLLSLFAPNLSLGYGDYTARVTHEVTEHDSVSVFGIGGYDHLDDRSGNLPSIDSQFHRADLRYDHRWKGGSLRLASTLGYDQSSRPLSSDTTNDDEIVHATSGRLRLELEQDLGVDAHLSAGTDVSSTHYIYEFTGSDAIKSPINGEQVFGAYAELVLRPHKRVQITAGMRFDDYLSSGTATTSLEPRLAGRVGLSRDVAWVSTFGVARQPPSYIIPVPGLRLDPASGLQAAYQLAEGVEAKLPWDLRARVTLFYTANRNTSDYVSECGSLASSCSLVERVDGRTYGLEAIVSRSFTKRFAGWVGYTLSRAERRIGGATYLSPFDRTHVVSAVASYDFGAGVRVGVRGTFYTGRPDIPSFYFGGDSPSFAFGPGQLQQHRLPPFYRVDVRAEKRWTLGTHEWVSVVFDFFDATLTKEAIEFRCDEVQGNCTAREVGPVALPSLGVEAGF